jgi:hypothetical protein
MTDALLKNTACSEMGNRISVVERAGICDYFAIKRTKLRNFSGEQVVCSNENLTGPRLRHLNEWKFILKFTGYLKAKAYLLPIQFKPCSLLQKDLINFPININ